MMEAKSWTFQKNQHFCTVGPFPSLEEAQKFGKTQTLQAPRTTQSRTKGRPRTFEHARKSLAARYPALMKHAENDPALYLDLVFFENHISIETSKIERAQKPIEVILSELVEHFRLGRLRAHLSQPCLLCGVPVKLHPKVTQRHHFAMVCALLTHPRIKKTEVVG